MALFEFNIYARHVDVEKQHFEAKNQTNTSWFWSDSWINKPNLLGYKPNSVLISSLTVKRRGNCSKHAVKPAPAAAQAGMSRLSRGAAALKTEIHLWMHSMTLTIFFIKRSRLIWTDMKWNWTHASWAMKHARHTLLSTPVTNHDQLQSMLGARLRPVGHCTTTSDMGDVS